MSQENDVSSPLETDGWMLPVEACSSRDWWTFERRLEAAAAQRGMHRASLEFPAGIDADRGALALGDV